MSEIPGLNLEAADRNIVLGILAKRIPERDVYVFGSRATNRAGRRSDLDLAIEGTLTLRQRAELTDDFSESDLPIEVDFVEVAMMTPIFRKRAEQEWLPLVKGNKSISRERAAA